MSLGENEGQRKLPVVTIILVGINVLVYLITESTGSSYDPEHLIWMGGQYEPAIIENHEWYRLITHFFIHVGVKHLLSNMFLLVVLGYSLENEIGMIRYGAIYMSSGIAGGLISLWYHLSSEQEVVACGASGAVFGLLGAWLVVILIRNQGKIQGQVPRVILCILLSLYSGKMESGIDNSAHVGGFLCGAVLCAVMCLRKPDYWKGD